MIIAGTVAASTEQQIAVEATAGKVNDDCLGAPPPSIVDSGPRHDGDWWKSGDARRLFAPSHSCSDSKYDTRCSVKEVVMNRIEVFEAVNCTGCNWNFVVDTSGGDQSLKNYSEADVLSLRFRSMYLAIALKQFVLSVTGNLQTQWTWKRCLQYAIKAMNNEGIEFYSSFATLACWHRKLAQNRFFLQGTRWKEFVSPLLSRQPWCNGSIQTIRTCQHQGPLGRDDTGVCSFWTYSEAHPASERFIVQWQWWWRRSRIIVIVQQQVANKDVTPTTKESFLQSYGLSTLLSITTILARWIHACGFRFKKREKHFFVDGHERPETIAYRPIFTKKYLNDEIRAHRWIQITLIQSQEME